MGWAGDLGGEDLCGPLEVGPWGKGGGLSRQSDAQLVMRLLDLEKMGERGRSHLGSLARVLLVFLILDILTGVG